MVMQCIVLYGSFYLIALPQIVPVCQHPVKRSQAWPVLANQPLSSQAWPSQAWLGAKPVSPGRWVGAVCDQRDINSSLLQGEDTKLTAPPPANRIAAPPFSYQYLGQVGRQAGRQALRSQFPSGPGQAWWRSAMPGLAKPGQVWPRQWPGQARQNQ